MYRQQNRTSNIKSATCPNCSGTSFLFQKGKLTCRDCRQVFSGGVKANKYGAKKTVAKDGLRRDSKFEAGVADWLFLRKQVGEIKDYDSQFKVECWAYNASGEKAFNVNHKVDFRIYHNDGSYELLEAKGIETSDYRWRRKCLEKLWLPLHKDHIYTIVKQRDFKR